MTQKVIDPNTGVETTVSDSSVRNAVESEQAVYKVTRDGPNRIRVYDVIDGTWMGPIDAGFAYQDYLRKVVFKCSCCNFTTSREHQVAEHVSLVFTTADVHRDATLEMHVEGGESWQQCSGCGHKFRTAKRAGGKHLEMVQAAPAAHKGAEELLMKRFALGPSEPTILGRTPVPTGEVSGEMEPEAKVSRSSHRRHRSRRRRNKGKVGE